MLSINLKPLSTNDAWRGRKFSTQAKKLYEAQLRERLEWCTFSGKPPYRIHFKFYISSMQDYDNCIKVSQDTLCEFFDINDRDIHYAIIEKIPTKRWEEHFEVEIESYKKRKSKK